MYSRYLLPVCDPTKGNVTHDTADSKYGHDEGSLLVLNPLTEGIGNQVDHWSTTSIRQEQEGQAQNQEVRGY